MSDAFWRTVPDRPAELTEERLRRAYDLMLNERGGPDMEYHHFRCPKITSGGAKACRCGAAPLEAIFEDELAAQ